MFRLLCREGERNLPIRGEPTNVGCGRNTANGGYLRAYAYDNTVPS